MLTRLCNRSYMLLLALPLGTFGSAIRADQPRSAPKKLNAPTLAQAIDQQIQRTLDKAKVSASPLADDAEFLRRVYLDIHGVIPPPDKVAAFLDSKDPDKRAKVVDELLANPQYGR